MLQKTGKRIYLASNKINFLAQAGEESLVQHPQKIEKKGVAIFMYVMHGSTIGINVNVY